VYRGRRSLLKVSPSAWEASHRPGMTARRYDTPAREAAFLWTKFRNDPTFRKLSPRRSRIRAPFPAARDAMFSIFCRPLLGPYSYAGATRAARAAVTALPRAALHELKDVAKRLGGVSRKHSGGHRAGDLRLMKPCNGRL
jgi:hypothetical protein